MKKSSSILLVSFILLIAAMLACNVLLKKEYDKLDKSDSYWTYGKILEQPFRHLVVEGGNISRIAFEPAATASVKVFKNWYGYEEKRVKANVKNDTLYLQFPKLVTNPGEKRFLEWNTMVRIFSPEILSVQGHNTNLGFFKMKQKNFSIDLSGKSQLEVESYLHDLDSLQIRQRDSSKVVFEISPDMKGKPVETAFSAPAGASTMALAAPQQKRIPEVNSAQPGGNSWETMHVAAIDANVRGISLLDVGHAQIGSLRLEIADTAAIILSGASLKKFSR